MERRTTKFEDNCKKENSPAAVSLAMKMISQKYPGCKIEKVEDKARQLKGIDYIAHTPNGPINIDVKIRKGCEDYWVQNHKSQQDYMIEYKQGSAQYGWGTDPSLETDFVLFLFPWMKKYKHNKRRCKTYGWSDALWLPHAFVMDFVSEYKDECPKRDGWNGYAYSYCITPTFDQLSDAYADLSLNHGRRYSA